MKTHGTPMIADATPMAADESKGIGAGNISTVIATHTEKFLCAVSADIGVASAAIGVLHGVVTAKRRNTGEKSAEG